MERKSKLSLTRYYEKPRNRQYNNNCALKPTIAENIDFMQFSKLASKNWARSQTFFVFQKAFILCLLAIGAVSGDVSHILQGGSNGYDYPVPSVGLPEPENNYLPPVVAPPPQCPPGTYGQYPNCQRPRELSIKAVKY